MVLLRTESRIPDGFSAYDLGQAVESNDSKYSLISNLSSPLHMGGDMPNELAYYVFINEPDELKFANYQFKWHIFMADSQGNLTTIVENTAPVEAGFVFVVLPHTGKLTVSVTVLFDGTNIELKLEQEVAGLNKILEDLYTNVKNNKNISIGAIAGKIETSREIMNDLWDYILLAAPPPAFESSSAPAFGYSVKDMPAKFLTAIIYELIFAYPQNTKDFRNSALYTAEYQLNMDTDNIDLLDVTYMVPLGVCQLSPQFVASALNVFPGLRAATADGINQRVDLLNLLRFPKTNIKVCAAILSKIKSGHAQYSTIKQEPLLKNNTALMYITEEFFKSLLSSLTGSSLTDDDAKKAMGFSKKAVQMLSYPFIAIQNYEPIYAFETYKIQVLDCRSGKPVPNAPVKRLKIGSLDVMFKYDSAVISTNASSIKDSQVALNGFVEEYNDASTTKQRSKYNCGAASDHYGRMGRAAFNKYWLERNCSFLSLQVNNGGDPLESTYKLIIDEYNAHRATDEHGYLNVKIPLNVLLTQEEIDIEVGFYDFPVVLEEIKADDRPDPICRLKNETNLTNFKIFYEGSQSIDWGQSMGWKAERGNTGSLFKVSEKVKAAMAIKVDGSKDFADRWTSVYYDPEKTVENPHAVLFAMQWCQPVWDEFDDPVKPTVGSITDTSYVQDVVAANIHMHLVSMYIDLGGSSQYGGKGYGKCEYVSMPKWRSKDKPTDSLGGHRGLDLQARIGDNVFAVHGGIVQIKDTSALPEPGQRMPGLMVKLAWNNTPPRSSIDYLHLSQYFLAMDNTRVLAGTIVGKAGRSGNLGAVSRWPGHVHVNIGADEYSVKLREAPDPANKMCIPYNDTSLSFPCQCQITLPAEDPVNCNFSAVKFVKSCWAAAELKCPHININGVDNIKLQVQLRYLNEQHIKGFDDFRENNNPAYFHPGVIDGKIGNQPTTLSVPLYPGATVERITADHSGNLVRVSFLGITGWIGCGEINDANIITNNNLTQFLADRVGQTRMAIYMFRRENNLLHFDDYARNFSMDDAAWQVLNRVASITSITPAPTKVTYRNTLIFQSVRKKGLEANGHQANDMKISDFTKEQLQAINRLFNFQLDASDNPDILFYELTVMATTLFSSGEMKDVIKDMINHFKSGSGTDYRNTVLTKQAGEHQTTKDYIGLVKNKVISELIINSGNLTSLKFNESTKATNPIYSYIQQNAKYPVFNNWADTLGGLTVTVNDTWGNYVEVRDYSVENNKFQGTLRFTIYDHFGLDLEDVKKVFVNLAGFRAWFVLQHYNKYNGKYRPFATIMEFDIPIEGNL